MKKAITTVHTIIVILGLFATAAWSGYFLYNQRQFNSEANAKRLPSLLEEVGSALSSSDTLYDRDFGDRIKSLFSENGDILALSIYSYDTGIEYFYSRNGQVSIKAAEAESVDQNPVYKGLSFSHSIASVSLSLKDKPGTNMDLVFTVLPRASIFYVLRISLLAVIVLFVVTLILIVAFSLSKGKESAVSNDEWDESEGVDINEPLAEPVSTDSLDRDFSDDPGDSFSHESSFDSPAGLDDSSDDMDFNLPDDESFSDDLSFDVSDDAGFDMTELDLPDDASGSKLDGESDDLNLDGLDNAVGDDLDDFSDTLNDELDDLNLEESIPDIPESEDLEAMDHEDSSFSDDLGFLEDDLPGDESFEIPMDSGDETPSDGEPTLYNPETGLGWEAFLEERLGLELERAASFDQDLVLIMIRKSSDGDMERISSKIKNAYSYPDLIFEAGSEALAMVDPNKDLDEAIENIQSLFRKLELEEGISGLSCGLSSRNGRLITGKRLIHEADTSLNKSDEENPIVGFRSDPDRFREYLSKNS